MATVVGGGGSAGVKGRNVDLEINLTGNLRKYIEQLAVSLDRLKKQTGTFSAGASKNFKDIDKSMSGSTDAMNKFDNTTSRTSKNMVMNFSKAHGITDKLYNKLTSFRGLTILGVGFGVKELIGNTMALRQEFIALRGQFAGLSDSTGSANAAMSVYYKSWGETKASFEQVSSAMQSLGEKGLSPVDEKTKGVNKEFQQLTSLSAQLGQATGVSTDAWASLNGQLAFSNKAKVGDIRQINSALIATNLTGGQLTTVMNFVNESIDKYSAFAKDGTKSTLALTKGVAGAASAMNKLGINSQKATEFMGGLMDPEKFGENQALLSQLGVSYNDYVQMLETGGGKETFFDKIMTQLPQFSQRLASIRDPFARMNLAKSLGLPVEIMQKMANASPGQVTAMMREYQVRAKDEEALKEKQQKMAENSAKMDERFKMIKMKLYTSLLPILERNMGSFMSLLSRAATIGGKLFKWIGERVEVFYRSFAKVLDPLLSGNFDKLPGAISEGIGNVTKDLMGQLSTTVLPAVGVLVGEILPKIMSGFMSGFWNTFKALPWWAEMIIGWKIMAGAITGIGALGSGIMGIVNFGRQISNWFSSSLKGNPVEMAQLTQLEQIKLLLAKQSGVAGAADKLGASDVLGSATATGNKAPGKWGARLGKAGNFLGKYGGAIATTAIAGYSMYSGVKDANAQEAEGKISSADANTQRGSAVGGGTGAIIGGIAGTAIGMKIGAAIGTFAGPIGIIIGGAIGAAAGWIGSKIGEAIAERENQEKQGIFSSERAAKQVNNADLSKIANAGNLPGQASRTITDKNRGEANVTMHRDMGNLQDNIMEKGGAGGLKEKNGEYVSYMLDTQTGLYVAQKKNAQQYFNEMSMAQYQNTEQQTKEIKSRMAAGVTVAAWEEALVKQRDMVGNKSIEMEYQRLELKKLAGAELNEDEKKKLEQFRDVHKTNMTEWANKDIPNGMKDVQAAFKTNYSILSSTIKDSLGAAMKMASSTFVGGADAMVAGLGAAQTAVQQAMNSMGNWEKFKNWVGFGSAEMKGAELTQKVVTASQSVLAEKIRVAAEGKDTREGRLKAQADEVAKYQTEGGQLELMRLAQAKLGFTGDEQGQFTAFSSGAGNAVYKDIVKANILANKEQEMIWRDMLKATKAVATIGAGSKAELEKMNKKETKPTDDSWAAFMKNSSFFGQSMLG